MGLLYTTGLTVMRPQRDGSSRAALQDVSLELAAGDVLMLIGPNGAGKSTLLSTLSGDLAPTHGEIEFDGSPLHGWNSRKLARRRAVLPQRPGLSLPFSGEEVVRLGCLARTESRAFIQHVVMAAARATGVDHLLDRAVTALSGGEQARIHLARVLAQIWPGPAEEAMASCVTRNLLLLDEPCASLDPHHQHAVCGVVRDFAHRTGTAVIITMHDMNLAAQYADRVLALRAGELAAMGAPREVLTREFVRFCFDVDAMHMEADHTMLVATRPKGADAA